MAKQFSANLEFTEREFRAPVRTSLNETKTGAILPASTGYCMTPIVIENENQLIANFGYPTDSNYKYWFDCSGYLKNGSNLTVVRPMIEDTENAGLTVKVTGEVGVTSKAGLYNEEIAMDTLDNATAAELVGIEIFNRFINKNNDIAVAVISNSTAYSAPLFADTKLVNGLSYYFKKPANYINDTATKYDIESVLDRTSTFVSNTYAHLYQGTSFIVQNDEPTPGSGNEGKIWVDSNIATSRLSVGGTHAGIVSGSKYLLTVRTSAGDVNGVSVPVIAVTNTTANVTTFNSLADDSSIPTVGIYSITIKSITNVDVVISVSPTISKYSNVALCVRQESGAYEWETLDVFVPSAQFGVDAAWYSFQKVENVLTTGTINTKYYDYKLDAGKFPELTDAQDTDWHLVIDGNDYNIDVDGKLYNYNVTSNSLSIFSSTDASKQPSGYRMVYTKDGNGNKVLSKIVPKYLVDGLYTNDGSIVSGKDIVAPTPNFSNSECAVLVFKKEFSSGKYDLVETFIGSYLYNAKNSSGASSFIETMINKNSRFIYCNVDSTPDVTLVGGINTYTYGIVSCMIIDGDDKIYDKVVNRRLGETDDGKKLNAVDLRSAADEFSIRGNTFVNLLIGYDNGLMSGYFDDMSEIAKESGTALAIVSYDSGTLAGNKNDVIRAGIVDALGNKRQDTTSGALTSFNDYTFVIATSKLLFDKYNNKDRWMGLSGDIAGRMTANDSVNGSWYAVAGTERGVMGNYKRLLWSPSAVNQNELSRNGLNYIINDRELGYAYMFEYMTNTTENKITAEANIRRLLLTLKDYMRTTLKGSFFSFNDAVERNAILYKITDTFNNIKSRRGLNDFRLICDETNNTADVINQQQFVVDVLIQPTRMIKFIKVNFSIFDAGFNIQEIEI